MDELPKQLVEGIEKYAGECDKAVAKAARAVLEAEDAADLYDAERAMRAAFMERADALMAVALNYKVNEPAFIEQCKARIRRIADQAGVSVKSHGAKDTRVRLLGGTVVRLKALMMIPATPTGTKRGRGQRGKAGSGVYPTLAQLGITSRSTPALRAEVAREVAEANSFAVARASLKERGLDLQHKTALRLAYCFADRALQRRERRIANVALSEDEPKGELAGKWVVVCVDGGRLRVRESDAGADGKYEAPWREPKVFSIYVVDENGKKQRKTETFIDGTLGNADAAFSLLTGHLKLLGANQAAHVSLHGDGASWIWNRAAELRVALGLDEEQFAEVVDRYHAIERLGTASKEAFWPSEEQRKAWVECSKALLSAGRMDDLLASIDELADSYGMSREACVTARGYFDGNRERMRYPYYRVHGIPEGSGSVESAIRRVVNLRLKGNSMYWLEEHAEGILHLRAQLKSGRWDELARETVVEPIWEPPASQDE